MNNINNEKIYKCAICGKEYETIEDRSKCEIACIEKVKAKAEAEKKKRLEEEKNVRKADIEKKYIELNELVKSFIKDYGSIKIHSTNPIDSFPTLSKLFDFWAF